MDTCLAVLVLCLECEAHVEAYTGRKERALRNISPEGRCLTCGSTSVMNVPSPEFKWQKKARIRRSLRIA